ncbi:hypothetical protein BG006_007590 [Podila minutissima]|uniref:Rho GDP-dissociation inhibitor n=1 Tax=Podila minutissima TaxID=64525 RepID=A0A9P5SGV0_9FUNG|nr:hypothetical protein BG006_007590 [Podila minutissima]
MLQHPYAPADTEPMNHGNIDDDDDFLPDSDSKYRPGTKKSVSEYLALDAEDPSLAAWKASLLGNSSSLEDSIPTSPENTTNVTLLQLALEVAGRPDVVVDLAGLTEEQLAQTVFTIKEGVEYRIKVQFHVRTGILSGLKYLQSVRRLGVTVDRTSEMVGSYAAQREPITVRFAPEEAPAGVLARGNYEVLSQFVDDDGVVHKRFQWAFEIQKDW